MTTPETQIGIAVASLIVVPVCVALWRHYRDAYRRAERSKLDEVLKTYATQAEVEMQFSELHRAIEERHQQHVQLLDTIRTEALQREGKVLGRIDAFRDESREENKEIKEDTRRAHERMDNVLHLLGDRRIK